MSNLKLNKERLIVPGVDPEYMKRSLTNIRPSDDEIRKIEELREVAKDYAEAVFELVPGSAERTLALRALEESVMWAVKAICLNTEGATEQRIGAS